MDNKHINIINGNSARVIHYTIQGIHIVEVRTNMTGAAADVQSKVKGVFFGQAIGDSIGLCTEFMNKEDVTRLYGIDKKLFRNIDKINDYHRSTWTMGDWTDDTDIFLCLVKSLIEDGKQYNSKLFAQNLSNWLSHGLTECGDKTGHGAGNTTSIWWGDEYNISEPERTGIRTLIYDPFRPFFSASNGSLMRISILGTLNLSIPELIEVVQRHSMTTHASPHCFLACVYYVILISKLMKISTSSSFDFTMLTALLDEVFAISMQAIYDYCMLLEGKMEEEVALATQHLNIPGYNMNASIVQSYQSFTGYDPQSIITEFRQYLEHTNLQTLSLDTQIGFVFKTIACAIVTLKIFIKEIDTKQFTLKDHESIGQLFHKCLSNITLEAGDADTNGCVAGALLGAFIGFDNIPTQLVDDLLYKNLLNGYYEQYLATGLATVS